MNIFDCPSDPNTQPFLHDYGYAGANSYESGGPTFSAITSRSYHPGGVDVLFGDGSARFIKSSINGLIWRALGTIAGGEVVSSDAY